MNLIILILILLISLVVLVWVATMLISDISAAVYIPTPKDHVNRVLDEFKMEAGEKFVDLGSGTADW